MPAPTTVAKPQHSPSHESSLGHSRYRYVIPPRHFVCVFFYCVVDLVVTVRWPLNYNFWQSERV